MLISSPFPPGTQLAVYLRHSPGEEQTIDSQRDAMRAWCAQYDLRIFAEFIDQAKSGASTAGREDFNRMVEWLERSKHEHPVAAVLVWSFSRFGRNFDDVQYYKGLLRRIGYGVVSITEVVPGSSVGRVVEALHDWKSEADLERLSTDVKRGLRYLGEKGYSIGGFPPIGYRKSAPIEIGRRETGHRKGEPRNAYKWEKDPATEARVHMAWKMKLDGANHWDIHRATHLCASPRGYTDFFRNETYAGVRKAGELRVENAHEAYVSREDFDRVQAMRVPHRALVQKGNSENHPARRKSDNVYLLTGILKCGYCGWSMVGNGKEEDICYRCDWRHRAGHEVCPQPSIVAYVLHDAVCDWLGTEVVTYERLQALREQLNATLSESNQGQRDHQAYLRGELDKVAKQIGHLLTAIERGGWTEEVQERLDARKREKLQIETDIEGI